MKVGGIYCILCLANSKFYVGSAVDFHKRILRHKWELRTGRHCNVKLQRAFDRHGEAAFVFAILEVVRDQSDLLQIEQLAIDQLKAITRGFNIASDVRAPYLGRKHSAETIRKMSEGKRGGRNPMFGISLVGEKNGMFGKKHSAETNSRRSKTISGPGNYFFGKHHTEESKMKQSRAMKGRPSYVRTPEHNAKMSALVIAGKQRAKLLRIAA